MDKNVIIQKWTLIEKHWQFGQIIWTSVKDTEVFLYTL